jgi:hypothetical protein
MALLLRGTALVMVASNLLVFVGIVVGHLSNAVTLTGNLEVQGTIHAIYIEDLANDFRFTLAETRCFDIRPSRASPDADAVPTFEPPYSRFLSNVCLLSICLLDARRLSLRPKCRRIL